MPDLKLADQFPTVDDEKLRISLGTLADKWNEFARSMIYESYNDVELLNIYRAARDSGFYQKGWKDKSHREILSFPNGYVYNFCKAVFEPMYGPEWMLDKRVHSHELVRPWMLIHLKK